MTTVHTIKSCQCYRLYLRNLLRRQQQQIVQDNSKLVDNPTDNIDSNEDMNGKTFLGSFSDATNELSSTTASAISLMVSNVRRTKNDFLAKELESRKELLQALVKDKNDTPV